MKNLLKTFALALLAGIILESCSSETPHSVAEKVIEAYKNSDFKILKKYSAQPLTGLIEDLEKMIASGEIGEDEREKGMAINKESQYEIISELYKEGDEQAEIRVKITSNGESRTTFIHLTKESGNWKADELGF